MPKQATRERLEDKANGAKSLCSRVRTAESHPLLQLDEKGTTSSGLYGSQIT